MIAFLLVAALLGAGCADDVSRERDYLEGMQRVERNLADRLTEQVARPVPQDPALLTQQSAELDEVIADLRADIEKLEPPERWEDEHERALASARELEVAFRQMSAASARKDRAGAKQAQAAAAKAALELDDALGDIGQDARQGG